MRLTPRSGRLVGGSGCESAARRTLKPKLYQPLLINFCAFIQSFALAIEPRSARRSNQGEARTRRLDTGAIGYVYPTAVYEQDSTEATTF